MSEKRNAGSEDGDKPGLDSLEEALVGTHQDEPAGSENADSTEDGSDDGAPSVPGHRSP